jgi:hypothetical protein
LERLRSSNKTRAFYQKLYRSQKDFQHRTIVCTDKDSTILSSDEAILERWAQYFDELLNGNVFKHLEGMTIVQNQGSPEIEEPVLTNNEVELAIKKLKNNKALQMNLIQAGPEYVMHLHQLMVNIWINEIIPEEWNPSTVCPSR